jgi:hypothetical protein
MSELKDLLKCQEKGQRFEAEVEVEEGIRGQGLETQNHMAASITSISPPALSRTGACTAAK